MSQAIVCQAVIWWHKGNVSMELYDAIGFHQQKEEKMLKLPLYHHVHCVNPLFRETV